MRVMAWPAFKNEETNPYNSLLYSAMRHMGVTVDEFTIKNIALKRYDIWHMHWPESLLNQPTLVRALGQVITLFMLMSWVKFRGTRIFWTAHNLAPHDRQFPWLEGWFYRHLLKRIDGVISLTQTGLEAVIDRFPVVADRSLAVVAHGHYRMQYPNNVTAKEARSALGIPADAKVLLFFGQIRAYKNVTSLIRAFHELSDNSMILVVAGKPRSLDLEQEIQGAAAGDERIRLFLDFIPSDQVQVFMNASDIVVLPYLEILNSGTALLALSFNRPILVPNMGSLGELKEQVGAEWVQTFSGPMCGDHIVGAISQVRHPPSGTAPLDGLEWDVIAKKTLDAFQADD